MKDKIWNLIAKIASRNDVSRWLYSSAKKRPYIHIGNYMDRWWLIPEKKWLPFAIRIHHIKREDADPYLHDHPFNWRTIVLSGSYMEEDAFGNIKTRYPGTTTHRKANELHRISAVGIAGAWTLFIIGKRNAQDWGFIVDTPAGPRKVSHNEYFSINDREGNQT